MVIVAFLDANVLASKTQRDWFLKLSLERPTIVNLVTSTEVLDETERVFLRRNPGANPGTASSLRARIEAVLTDVFKTSQTHDEVIGVDPGDWHVHHSVIESEAKLLITNNIRHFSGDYPYSVTSPDDALCQMLLAQPEAVLSVARSEEDYWGRQSRLGRPAVPLHQALSKAQCPRFGSLINEFLR